MKCPKCGSELDELQCSEQAINYYRVMINDKGRLDFEEIDSDGSGEPFYTCPYCDVELARNDEEAKMILKGEPDKGLAERLAEMAFEEGK